VGHGLRLDRWAGLHWLNCRSRLNRARLHWLDGRPGLNCRSWLDLLGHGPLGDRSHWLDGPLLDHRPLLDGLARWNHWPLLNGLDGPDWQDGPSRLLSRLWLLREAASLRNRLLLRPS